MRDKVFYETADYVFFYGSIYSQWAIFPIKIDDVWYNCCEQFMMAQKAILFDDFVTLGQIMEAASPYRQKMLGKQVTGFDKEKWEKVAKDVVYKGNYAKFTQHPELKVQLLATGNKIIVEASPTDCIWGIGLAVDNDLILDPQNWRGTNWLGECIMKVRETLRREKNGN